MATLSFNRKLFPKSSPDVTVHSSLASKFDSREPLPLRYSWSLWEQLQQNQPTGGHAEQPAPTVANASANYGDLTRKVATMSDIQEFWRYFIHLPQPSTVLGESMKVVRKESDEEGASHTLAALMLFKENVRPEWEDPANRKGGHFQFTLQLERSRSSAKESQSTPKDLPNSWLAQTDEFWNNLVLGLLGGTLDSDDFVTGIRLVDKVKIPAKQGARPVGHIRIEIWFRDASDSAKISALEHSIETHLRSRLDGTLIPEVFPGYRLDMRTHAESTHGEGGKAAAGRGPRKLGTEKSNPPRKFGGRKGSTDHGQGEEKPTE